MKNCDLKGLLFFCSACGAINYPDKADAVVDANEVVAIEPRPVVKPIGTEGPQFCIILWLSCQIQAHVCIITIFSSIELESFRYL